jgi:NADPH2:quinone reductase
VVCAVRYEGNAIMKAITFKEFGEADVLQLTDVPTPEVRAADLLVRVHAAGVNRADLTRRQAASVRPPCN